MGGSLNPEVVRRCSCVMLDGGETVGTGGAGTKPDELVAGNGSPVGAGNGCCRLDAVVVGEYTLGIGGACAYGFAAGGGCVLGKGGICVAAEEACA